MKMKTSEELINETVLQIHKDLKGRCAFAGSFGLKLSGLIDREVFDIDVVLFDKPKQDKKAKQNSSGTFDVDEEQVIFHACNDYPVKVDYFYKKSKPEFTKVKFMGKVINVEASKNALIAKLELITDKMSLIDAIKLKHYNDLKHIITQIA